MTEYVTSALFVYIDDTAHLIKPLQNNSSETRITPVAFDALMQTPHKYVEGVDHVVVAGPLDVIKAVLRLAIVVLNLPSVIAPARWAGSPSVAEHRDVRKRLTLSACSKQCYN